MKSTLPSQGGALKWKLSAFPPFGAVLLALVLVEESPAQTTFVSTGAVWKYCADGVDQGSLWRTNEFDDAQWAEGLAPLGWGNGDEATVIPWGKKVPRPVTTYFRRTFVVSPPHDFATLTLRSLSDDGMVVFLNGREIHRRNLPAGPVSALTFATTAVEGAKEYQLVQAGCSPYALVAGTNVLAVELHQSDGEARDGRFDLALWGGLPRAAPVIRLTSPDNGTVAWEDEISLTTETWDLDGHVERVVFYANTTRIGDLRSPPFDLVWELPAPGRYVLHAEAIDNTGRQSSSEPVHLQVGYVTSNHVVRGPYLQTPTPTNIVIRWRTDWFTDSFVRYGTNRAALFQTVYESEPVTEHVLQLKGLRPGTKYYYAFGSTAERLTSGPDFYFVASPSAAKPTRVWVIGDSGTADDNARSVRDAYERFATNRPADLWLMLGDNAYEGGTEEQHQTAVFDMYPRQLRQTPLWPTIGNHEATFGPDVGFSYLDIFTLPTKGEAGGVPSGTERYYSFDYGNIHFVCLDSSSSDASPGSAMLNWLERDLAATGQDWIIAFWHHPPYSKGTHHTDWEPESMQIRAEVLPMLESYGVDLVLCGHSHVYERSFLLNGHYGDSSTLNSGMILDGSLGRPDMVGPYRRPAGGLGAGQGTVYLVCGCSGGGAALEFDRHPAMAINLFGLGSVVLDIEGDRLEARFLRPGGEVDDYFAIRKGPPGPEVRPQLRVTRGRGGEISVSWPTSLAPFRLEASDLTEGMFNWQEFLTTPQVIGRSNIVTISNPTNVQVFRLHDSR